MKNFSYRIWVLILGVAVAAVIVLALVFNGSSHSPFSNSPTVTQKAQPVVPSVLFRVLGSKL